jgi:hypothetical protein
MTTTPSEHIHSTYKVLNISSEPKVVYMCTIHTKMALGSGALTFVESARPGLQLRH